MRYQQFQWSERDEYLIGRNNVLHEPLVDPEKVLMPPLHIKLGLIKKHFVKVIDVLNTVPMSYGRVLSVFFLKLNNITSLSLNLLLICPFILCNYDNDF